MKSNRRRALRAGMAVMLVTTVSLAGASINEWWRALPPPEQCNGEQLVRWMVTRDLNAESLATRRALVERLIVHLCEGMDTQRIDDFLSTPQKRRFATNARLLMATWFEDAAVEYAGLDPHGREQFLDEQLALVDRWDLDALTHSLSLGKSYPPSAGASFEAPAGVPSPLVLLNEEMSRWIDDAQGSRRETLQSFASAIRMRLVTRVLQPFTSTSANSSS